MDTTRTTVDKHGLPCESCGDRTAFTRYADTHGWCHKCETWFPPTDDVEGFVRAAPKMRNLEMTGVIQSISDRRISKATCEKYGVTSHTGADGNITAHYYPYMNTETKQIVASKKRVCADKAFSWSGDRTGTGLFGQQTCRGGGKYITIVEGELDALAVSEMFDNRFDVVSLKDGAAKAERDISENIEFLESYDNIVLCFDNDDAGRKAVDACKDVFSPNKLKIVTLKAKDAGLMLQQGQVKEFVKKWWDAKAYLPVGIVKVSETWDEVIKYRDTPSIPYPWAGLNDLLLGQRRKEINIWAAETGIGKSQTMRELMDHLIVSTEDEHVGCLMLEESIAKTTLGLMSFKAGRPLHKELSTIPDEELRKYWEMASQGDRLVLLDHKGWGNNMETLKARIRYMRYAMGCHTILLDHLHIALSSVQGATGDWSGIDELMTDFVGLVNELDICLHLVCHVSEPRKLRGSKGIDKLSDAVIFLERDSLHEDPEIANTTSVIVTKNRFVGDVGTACYLRYDKGTHRMTECAKPIDDGGEDEF